MRSSKKWCLSIESWRIDIDLHTRMMDQSTAKLVIKQYLRDWDDSMLRSTVLCCREIWWKCRIIINASASDLITSHWWCLTNWHVLWHSRTSYAEEKHFFVLALALILSTTRSLVEEIFSVLLKLRMAWESDRNHATLIQCFGLIILFVRRETSTVMQWC